MDYGWISLAVPLFTIAVALISKDVIVSLIGGIVAGLAVIHHYDITETAAAFSQGLIALFKEGWIVKTLLFSLFVGAIIKLLEASGAIASFVAYLDAKATRINSPLGAQLLAFILGIVIFIESSITSLVAGTVARPLCDRHGVSRAKLAYICDSTAAPICALIPLNAWGALLLGLIATGIQTHTLHTSALSLLVASLPYNFYALVTLGVVFVVITKGWHIGPMKHACNRTSYATRRQHISEAKVQAALMPLLLPIVTLVLAVPVGLYITGNGNIFKGSGSTSVYAATIVTLEFMYIYYRFGKRISHRAYMDAFFQGMGEMLPIATVLLLALFIGDVITDLGTARYLASLLDGHIPSYALPTLVFVAAALTAFSTGTSWGTFSIMMPIAMALAATMHQDMPLMIAAVVAGGIFGDHASPISDTTVIASMAAQCDHIEHVRTQLPYALFSATVSALAFLAAGILTQG